MEPAATTDAPDIQVLTHKGVRAARRAADIKTHDFRQSGFLAASELRRIRQRHEQFVRSLAARLAMFLRLECRLTLAKVHILGFQKFTETLSSPTHITLFKTEPLKGGGLLAIPPRLALQLVDRLLGGPGELPAENRDLSDIEVALSDQAAALILSEWCNSWPELRELHHQLLGHENNSKFLQTAPPETSMIIISVESSIADQQESFHLVFPYATVEPLMRLINPTAATEDAAAPRAVKSNWNAGFDSVQVPLTAEWQGLKMSAADVTRLKPGDLLSLDPACAAQVLVRLGNVPKFLGRPGTSDARWAVQLTSAISS
jgi:flagellar motor switch protein FliM